jgi:hypothetical protein
MERERRRVAARGFLADNDRIVVTMDRNWGVQEAECTKMPK